MQTRISQSREKPRGRPARFRNDIDLHDRLQRTLINSRKQPVTQRYLVHSHRLEGKASSSPKETTVLTLQSRLMNPRALTECFTPYAYHDTSPKQRVPASSGELFRIDGELFFRPGMWTEIAELGALGARLILYARRPYHSISPSIHGLSDVLTPARLTFNHLARLFRYSASTGSRGKANAILKGHDTRKRRQI